MPHPETDDRHQYAVLWTRAGYNKYGEPKLNAPTEIKVRWEDQVGLAFDTGGDKIATDAKLVVDRDIDLDSIMWKGRLADLPSPVTNVKKVVGFSSIPDIKNRVSRRTVLVAKYSDELPELA